MDAGMRAADADRERVVTLLQQQVGAGRLTLEEFSDRAAGVYRARTLGELDALTRDLPVAMPEQSLVPSRRVLVPVLAVLALLVVGALLAFVGPAGAMLAHVGAGCG
jgi:hypothetical protein